MDFGLTEEQAALQDLSKKIFRGLGTPESLEQVEKEGDGFHRVVWDGLAKGEVLGASLPTEVGGGGYGLLELCLLLEQLGDSAVPMPLLPTLAFAALPIAEFGTPEQRERLLEPVVRGESVLTGALEETSTPPTAAKTATGYELSGTCEAAPALHLADRVLVFADAGEAGVAAFLVDPKASGARIDRQRGTNDAPLGRLTMSRLAVASDDMLGAPERGADIRDWTLQRAWLGQCAVELGLARRALILTAQYATERHQFGRPIATFQAVSQRTGDAYVDVETIRLSLWRAAFLLDQGQDARREIAVAKIVAAEAGHRVVCAAQHVHGGIGFDRDYALHRYFLASKQNEFTLGSASRHVAELGALIARGD